MVRLLKSCALASLGLVHLHCGEKDDAKKVDKNDGSTDPDADDVNLEPINEKKREEKILNDLKNEAFCEAKNLNWLKQDMTLDSGAEVEVDCKDEFKPETGDSAKLKCDDKTLKVVVKCVEAKECTATKEKYKWLSQNEKIPDDGKKHHFTCSGDFQPRTDGPPMFECKDGKLKAMCECLPKDKTPEVKKLQTCAVSKEQFNWLKKNDTVPGDNKKYSQRCKQGWEKVKDSNNKKVDPTFQCDNGTLKVHNACIKVCTLDSDEHVGLFMGKEKMQVRNRAKRSFKCRNFYYNNNGNKAQVTCVNSQLKVDHQCIDDDRKLAKKLLEVAEAKGRVIKETPEKIAAAWRKQKAKLKKTSFKESFNKHVIGWFFQKYKGYEQQPAA